MSADILLLRDQIGQIGIGVALVGLFTMIAIRKTQGGLGWHWGTRK
ncbi:hypothetical protein [Sphingomonas sp. Ant H11]|nr:hypothetical protein [Sphingomonas sp. Ant H11]